MSLHTGNLFVAGMVDKLSVYPWSTYHANSGVKDLPWLETSVVLSVYCDRKGFIEAQKEYAKEEGDCLRNLNIAFSWELRPPGARFKNRRKGIERNLKIRKALMAMDIDDIVKAIFKQFGEEGGESMMKTPEAGKASNKGSGDIYPEAARHIYIIKKLVRSLVSLYMYNRYNKAGREVSSR